jgi:UDP-N-acetylmuramate: L-alanyl-gamma-D-glutamyl-meso-diaminopimelate ligase
MGALAGLLRRAGDHVTGSDKAFYPPIGDKLSAWGVQTMTGYDEAHLSPRPDLVVVGNVCRSDNPEARAAIDGGIDYVSMPGALERLFLSTRRNFVIAGTHGKTTTSALTISLLNATGKAPGYLVGGIVNELPESFALGEADGPFVIEGDEYDSAFFEKQPKFWRYHPYAVALTSVEHDHIDIYPSLDAYRDAFARFLALIPEDGLLVAYAGDPEVRDLARSARCRVSFYALDSDDTGDVTPVWLAAPAPAQGNMQPFDLFFGGSSCGRVFSPLSGLHNVKNATAAIALCAEGGGSPVNSLVRKLMQFGGVKRRQELVAIADGVHVYDDFAHHPSAVRETLGGLRARHPKGKLIALFEPRSATASRKLHQDVYAQAFEPADWSLLAPVGRPEIAAAEKLDVAAIAAELRNHARRADAFTSHDEIVANVVREARPGDTLVVMSNGDFAGILDRIVSGLTMRSFTQRTTTEAL